MFVRFLVIVTVLCSTQESESIILILANWATVCMLACYLPLITNMGVEDCLIKLNARKIQLCQNAMLIPILDQCKECSITRAKECYDFGLKSSLNSTLFVSLTTDVLPYLVAGPGMAWQRSPSCWWRVPSSTWHPSFCWGEGRAVTQPWSTSARRWRTMRTLLSSRLGWTYGATSKRIHLSMRSSTKPCGVGPNCRTTSSHTTTRVSRTWNAWWTSEEAWAALWLSLWPPIRTFRGTNFDLPHVVSSAPTIPGESFAQMSSKSWIMDHMWRYSLSRIVTNM